MPLPKYIAGVVCVSVLGAQVIASSSGSSNRHGWYWPFLAYPMYAESHARSDTLVIPELRVDACAKGAPGATLTSDSLSTPHNQLGALLIAAARAPGSSAAKGAEAKLSRAVEAQYPARFCRASAWIGVVRVGDTSTHHLDLPMRGVVTWPVNGGGSE
ncbi:MAG: hypothetical protein ABI884_12360 [Gemmatimonadota bacterium]